MHEVDASRNHEGGADAPPDQLGNERLHLRDIVCHAGNQGAAPEGIKLRKGKPHNPPEHLLSHIVPDVLRREVHEYAVQRPADSASRHNGDHGEPEKQNIPGAPLPAIRQPENSLIDKGLHERGQKKVRRYLSRHKEHG